MRSMIATLNPALKLMLDRRDNAETQTRYYCLTDQHGREVYRWEVIPYSYDRSHYLQSALLHCQANKLYPLKINDDGSIDLIRRP